MHLSFRDVTVSIGIIAVVSLVVYGGSLTNNFVQFDDNTLITSNPAVVHVSFSSIGHVFSSYDPELYIPLTLFTFQMERLFFGFNPFVFHLTSLLLHIANASLVFLFLVLLGQRRWIAFAGGLLFAVHPQNTEAVAWASGLKDVLATFFGLASLICYELSYERSSRKLLALSIVLFLLGLLSKAVLVPLPAALILLDWYRRRPIFGKNLLQKIPYVFLSAAFFIVALFGKQELIVETTWLQKILMAAKSTVFYLQKFFVPTHLTVIYPYTDTIALASPDFFIPLTIVIVLTLISFIALRWSRVVVFGWLFFLAFLAPTFVNFSKGGALYFASDRYAYIPSIGLLVVFAASLEHLSERYSSARRWKFIEQLFIVVGIIVAAAFGIAAREQSHIWKDSETLFTQVLSLYPNALLARNNLANIYRDQGHLDDALSQYEEALQVNPKNAIIWSNMGILYRSMGRVEDAIKAYDTSMSLRPDFADAPYNRGYLEYQRGDRDAALMWYQKALIIEPRHVRARIGVSVVLSEEGKDAEAMKALVEGARLQPDIADFPFNLGVLLEKVGERKAAKIAYQHAIDLNPYHGNALNNLGAMAMEDHDYKVAKSYFERALKLNPDDPDILQNLRSIDGIEPY